MAAARWSASQTPRAPAHASAPRLRRHVQLRHLFQHRGPSDLDSASQNTNPAAAHFSMTNSLSLNIGSLPSMAQGLRTPAPVDSRGAGIERAGMYWQREYVSRAECFLLLMRVHDTVCNSLRFLCVLCDLCVSKFKRRDRRETAEKIKTTRKSCRASTQTFPSNTLLTADTPTGTPPQRNLLSFSSQKQAEKTMTGRKSKSTAVSRSLSRANFAGQTSGWKA